MTSVLRRLSLALLIALLVADGLSFGAQAYTTQTWNTTALFDSGTKASTSTLSDYCENVSANSLALNNTGSFIGVGMTTGSANCKTGAWGVNPAGLVLAYDMQTLASGKVKDFSGNGNAGTIGGSPIPTASKFGGGYHISNTTAPQQYVSASNSSTLWPSTAVTLMAWIKPDANSSTSTDTNTQLETVVIKGAGAFGGGSAANQFAFGMDLRQSVGLFYWRVWDTGTVTHDASFSMSLLPTTAFSCVVGQWTPSWQAVYLNGIRKAGSTVNFQIQQTLNPFSISNNAGLATTRLFNGVVDEVLYFRANLTQAQITSLCTDGRSSFLSSGSWQSSSVAFTTAPAFTTLTFSGGSASNRPSRLLFTDAALGAVVFDTLIPSGLASPIQTPVNLTFNPASWKVKLNMVGNGSATASMTSILMTLGAAPLFQTSDIIFLFGLLLVGLCVFGLLPDGAEFPLITIIAALILALWGFLFFYPQVSNPVYLVGIVGLSVLFLVLGLGKFMSEALG